MTGYTCDMFERLLTWREHGLSGTLLFLKEAHEITEVRLRELCLEGAIPRGIEEKVLVGRSFLHRQRPQRLCARARAHAREIKVKSRKMVIHRCEREGGEKEREREGGEKKKSGK